MALRGSLTPVVLVPRFTSYVSTSAGATSFPGIALDVSEFVGGTFAFWRGPILDFTDASVEFEESADGDTWFSILSLDIEASPTVAVSYSRDIALTRQWLRIRIVIDGSDPAMTCWCAGSLEQRMR